MIKRLVYFWAATLDVELEVRGWLRRRAPGWVEEKGSGLQNAHLFSAPVAHASSGSVRDPHPPSVFVGERRHKGVRAGVRGGVEPACLSRRLPPLRGG